MATVVGEVVSNTEGTWKAGPSSDRVEQSRDSACIEYVRTTLLPFRPDILELMRTLHETVIEILKTYVLTY